jgi:hypothetical protein
MHLPPNGCELRELYSRADTLRRLHIRDNVTIGFASIPSTEDKGDPQPGIPRT